MSTININRHNVGRMAERIVSNELESRGFRVSDLNKEGMSANADLLAAKDGRTWQIQVKGATEGGSAWWVNYGFCQQEVIDGQKTMYNSVPFSVKINRSFLICSEHHSLREIATGLLYDPGNVFHILTVPSGEDVKVVIAQEALQNEFGLQMRGFRISAKMLRLDAAHEHNL